MQKKTRTRLTVFGAVVALIVAGVLVVPHLIPNGAVGQELYELQGVTTSASYSTPGSVPASSAPIWFPSTATDIHLKASGPKAKQRGKVLLDAAVPNSFALPTDCVAGNIPFPWDDGWDGIDTTGGVKCGIWSALLTGGRLYVWK